MKESGFFERRDVLDMAQHYGISIKEEQVVEFLKAPKAPVDHHRLPDAGYTLVMS